MLTKPSSFPNRSLRECLSCLFRLFGLSSSDSSHKTNNINQTNETNQRRFRYWTVKFMTMPLAAWDSLRSVEKRHMMA